MQIQQQKAEVLLSRQQRELQEARAANIKNGWMKCLMKRESDHRKITWLWYVRVTLGIAFITEIGQSIFNFIERLIVLSFFAT